MKTIGMLGGLSWESTASYYRLINRFTNQALGGLHSAKICMYSLDFDEIEKLQINGDWKSAADVLCSAALSIEAGGADFIIICSNTMHKLAGEVEASISIPLLHIADATGEKLVEDNIKCAGLLGTRYTMEQDFYKNRIAENFNIKIIVPETQQQNIVHDIIYSELCLGKIREESRENLADIITLLEEQGAEAVILGCTELSMLIGQQYVDVPLYDTTEIHALNAVAYSLSG